MPRRGHGRLPHQTDRFRNALYRPGRVCEQAIEIEPGARGSRAMKERVEVTALTVGMFVAELDRPWLETPFLLQGFLVESQQEIDELRKYCKFVYIEPEQSTGCAYRPPPKESAGPQSQKAVRPQDVPFAYAGRDAGGGFLNTIMRIKRAA